eukprot:gnl/TRDRNA2_/TRDRNA2_204562_c0_seq1.p1 gnl/TRDRNA2_/TRDRNA2_204562_c0~~gnl/TRDRNA2_/TRDRNA2_204562_c0_seq1.p1  ORF type:complete len:252 (+),score=39.32 gnl/TRDRNA2_/TRDRNA2_204562_c0_seq1:109-864(+)
MCGTTSVEPAAAARQPTLPCKRPAEVALEDMTLSKQHLSAMIALDDLPPLATATLLECVARVLMCAIDEPERHSVWRAAACTAAYTATEGNAGREVPKEASKKSVNIFDSSAVPGISVERYLRRLKDMFRCSDSAFVLALVVMDRFLERNEVMGEEPRRLTMLNVHRLFLGSLMITVKFNEDLVYGNAHYARAGGIHVREVNRLECYLLKSLDYNLHTHPNQFWLYEGRLRVLSDSKVGPVSVTEKGECLN